jgi:hypothetical protein
MTHIFQNDSLRQQCKWLSFSKKTIKGGKTCGSVEKILMASFGWFKKFIYLK